MFVKWPLYFWDRRLVLRLDTSILPYEPWAGGRDVVSGAFAAHTHENSERWKFKTTRVTFEWAGEGFE